MGEEIKIIAMEGITWACPLLLYKFQCSGFET